jgi:type VI secretion system protein ImpC
MASNSQKDTGHNPVARVRIEYNQGDWSVELPFVMGVMSDLSGKPIEPLPPVAHRRFMEIDIDNLEDCMRAIRPRVAFHVPNLLTGEGNLSIDITFECMEDFSPAAIARQTDELNRLLVTRQQLAHAINAMDGEGKTAADGLFASAIKGLKRVGGSDGTLSVQAMVAELDKKLSEQINLILKHQDFQQMESAWRGLHHLVKNTESNVQLRVRVLDISKHELGATLRLCQGMPWTRNPIFQRICEDAFMHCGGTPFGCIVGDYYFNHGPQDVELLSELSKILAAAHTPFIAAADPGLMNLSAWCELGNPGIQGFAAPEYAAWTRLRQLDDARYIGLTLPRFLARLPYGARTHPVQEFNFEEDTGSAHPAQYTWVNPAYAMAVNINRAFKAHGWCARIFGIETGGLVDNLPTGDGANHVGSNAANVTLEASLTERQQLAMAALGCMSLSHNKCNGLAVFHGAQSLHRPAVYGEPDDAANAHLAAWLPGLFAACRFAHYLKCIARDVTIGGCKTREQIARQLNAWIIAYVDTDPDNSSEATQAQKPLAAADIILEDIPGNLHHYAAKFFLRPHYQLKGLVATYRLVSEVPAS